MRDQTETGFSDQDKALLTAGGAMWSTATVAGLPPLNMADGPMGVASGRVDERDIAVLTPAPVALGASWDDDLVRRVGRVVGAEAARSGVDALLAPNLNLPRSPLAGRAFEYFSEDPFLTGALGRAWAEGLQSQGVGAIPKHLTCNDSETERHAVDIQISEATLREVYLLPFEMALAAQPAGFLMAYNRVNGSYCSEHALLMNQIIKSEWQFSGLLVSDWFGVMEGTAAMQAGLDLEMPGPGRQMGGHCLDMLVRGEIDAARLDDAAARVAATARRFAGQGKPAPLDRATLIEAAAAGMVLLKNEGAALPLDPTRHKRVALIGPNWTAPCYQGGTFAKIAVDPSLPTPREAVEAALSDRFDLRFAQGCLPEPILPPMPVTPVGQDDQRGMLVSYFDSHDFSVVPIAIEIRDTNSLTWFARTGIAAAVDRAAGVCAAGIFTPLHTGPHRIYAGGTGAIRVLVDGVEVHANDTVYAPADIMGRLKSGEADCVELDFPDLSPRRIQIELRHVPAHVQGLWYGIEGPDRTEALYAEAETVAANADLVLLMVGETSDASVESKDRQDTQLSTRQLDLIARVRASNPATVVIVNVGHALDLGFAEDVAGLMLALYPGQAFGPALAEVLDGQREPGGRLAFTIARQDTDYPALNLTPQPDGRLSYDEGSLIGYRSFLANGTTPRFGLGEGMGYAAPALLGASLDKDGAVRLRMANAANRSGKAVLQVYAAWPEDRHVALVGYAAPVVAANSEQYVEIGLDLRPLRRWRDGCWLMPQTIRFYAGLSLDDALSRPEFASLAI
ncbi:beta-glucosidase [Paracoccus aestuariivivens]|uniref:Beta-glucosidase n=1 Tax=Paracoccus aestuariivivens TaxID=1820333 RepID=A0A6L6JEN9_9RHOB|nr:glycoside hydrolase family 3 C-terminal domain-containing protein [Paracoccus aestuariivivens]MTH79986.1 beta-glucosidase [Paracoccus aestuariivivens]